MMKSMIEGNESLSIDVAETPPAGFFEFVESMVFGHNAVQYQRKNLALQWQRFKNPTVIVAKINERIVGSYVLDCRNFRLNSQPLLGVYRGLLAVHPDQRRKRVAETLLQAAKQVAQEVGVKANLPTFSYGCIQQSNEPSLRLLKGAGCQNIGNVRSQLIYRQWLVKSMELQAEKNFIPAIDAGSSDDVLRDVSGGSGIRYFSADKKGARISACASLSTLKMCSLGKFNDWVVRCLVKPFPVARKRFNPDNFEHLVLNNIEIRKGCEADWKPFIGSLLATHQVHYAQIFFDSRMPPFPQLAARKLYNAEAGEGLEVLARPEWGMTLSDLVTLKALALYPVDF